jgi:major membrane immunogen (membrane-anchored lipoprotein)
MKKILLVVMIVFMVLLSSCTAADVASQNLSQAADSFEVTRRIVFYNGITGDYMLEIDGLCSLGNSDVSGELSVTCKVGEGQYKKHFLGLSDNVTYFVEQIEPVQASQYYYRVIFKPSVIIPDIDLQLP